MIGIWLVLLLQLVQPRDTFDFGRTMRVDYFHTGGPPPARRCRSIAWSTTDRGPAAGRSSSIRRTSESTSSRSSIRRATALIYSRGFASVYGEWETTPEAKTAHRTFHESLRFPWPAGPGAGGAEEAQADDSFASDLDDERRSGVAIRERSGAKPARRDGLSTLFENGPAAEKVDLLVIGEGYTDAQLPKFRKDAERLLDRALRGGAVPVATRRTSTCARSSLPAAETGVNRPHAGDFRRTPLSTEYNIFDSERYMLTLDNRALRDAASAAPYEFIEILVNEKQYGGGGIFNDQATASVDTAFSDYVFVHEFGHHFAALADEYYTSDVAYETGGREAGAVGAERHGARGSVEGQMARSA